MENPTESTFGTRQSHANSLRSPQGGGLAEEEQNIGRLKWHGGAYSLTHAFLEWEPLCENGNGPFLSSDLTGVELCQRP